MLRKIIWFLIIIVVAWVWSSTVMKSCSSSETKKYTKNLGQDKNEKEKPLFQADEDAGDDEYMIGDEDGDIPEEEDILRDKKEALERAAKDAVKDTKTAVKDKTEAVSSTMKAAADQIKKNVKKTTSSSNDTQPKGASKKSKSSLNTGAQIGDYLLVTGSFSNELNANSYVEKLKKMGYNNASKVVFDFSQYFTVVAGKYKSESSAKAKELELERKGIDAYVHKVKSKFDD